MRRSICSKEAGVRSDCALKRTNTVPCIVFGMLCCFENSALRLAFAASLAVSDLALDFRLNLAASLAALVIDLAFVESILLSAAIFGIDCASLPCPLVLYALKHDRSNVLQD
jgi:NhaP-type Na+/H+ and K+/H+ antiporter